MLMSGSSARVSRAANIGRWVARWRASSLLIFYPPISSSFFGSSLSLLPHTPHRKMIPRLSVLKWDNWTCWRQDQRRTAPSRLSMQVRPFLEREHEVFAGQEEVERGTQVEIEVRAFCIQMIGVARVKVCNSITFETGWNLPPVLIIVTYSAHAV